ncbi:MAG: 2-C-methyl-D-erythritol 4-phosphate cytidylyltransferase [Pyrinomonadaceae bacterium]|nr:2-C-methyl-D-erythritol 4-phosphate cytidylyltransferase [Pyrinomonadaceae bacterium]
MNVAIIVAAGQGTRAGGRGDGSGGGRAKQFRELVGEPVIIHTLRRFEQSAMIGEVFAVGPAAQSSALLQLLKQYQIRKVARVVAGGATRTESVWRGLQAVRSTTAEIVAVHDGVRPFVTPDEIDETVRAAQAHGAAILAAPIVETIKEINNGRVARTLEREGLRRALTPQCFRYELLRRAYETALSENLTATDDSALVERLGIPVAIVEGHPRNIKITRPEDFALAEVLLKEFAD